MLEYEERSYKLKCKWCGYEWTRSLLLTKLPGYKYYIVQSIICCPECGSESTEIIEPTAKKR